jgi:xanthine dehydrogenase accessory factor
MSETAEPLAVCRTTCFSEAAYEGTKTIEGVTAEKASPSLEQVYKIWRAGRIPLIVDPEMTVKALVRPAALIHAMMLKRATNTRSEDAPLVIGIGTGFSAGENVHAVIGAGGKDLGRLILDGASSEGADLRDEDEENSVVVAEDSGVFTTVKNICDSVTVGEIIGYLDDAPLASPCEGIVRGVLKNETKVLAGTPLAEVEKGGNKESCFTIRSNMRAIAGGVLEAIMFAYNSGEDD